MSESAEHRRARQQLEAAADDRQDEPELTELGDRVQRNLLACQWNDLFGRDQIPGRRGSDREYGYVTTMYAQVCTHTTWLGRPFPPAWEPAFTALSRLGEP